MINQRKLPNRIMKLNHYELVEKINEGGSGSIYKGINLNTGILVAIKVLNKTFQSNTIAVKKFQFEANQYLYLQHTNIVKLLDFNITNTPYLVMEYVDGMNMDEYINKITGPISINKVKYILTQLLSAIEYSHQKNVLHLDIKPSNIMINNSQQIKVLDFGISKTTEEDNDKMFVGSPYYMSPEQVTQAGIGKASDIYSIGITLYQMVTGQLPFDKKLNREEVFDKIINGDLDKPSTKYPSLAKTIENIILTATALKPNDRYTSCNQFQQTLINL